ncbi:uncharacterized protein [Hoplias malabaricus]
MPLFRQLDVRPERIREREKRNQRQEFSEDEEEDEPSSLTRLCLLSLAKNMKDLWVQDYAQNYMNQYFFRYVMGPFSLLPGDLLEELLCLLSRRNLLSRAALHLLIQPQLHHISLSHSCNLITANICSLITARCQSLKSLNLNSATNVSAPALCSLLSSLSHLQDLSLAGTMSDHTVIATVAHSCLGLKYLDISRCVHLHPAALLPLAHSSGLKCLSRLLALDIGLEENEDNGTASAAFLLLALPSLRQVALDNVGQACVLIWKREFCQTDAFTSKERVASLQELWNKRLKTDKRVYEKGNSFNLEEKLDKSLDLESSDGGNQGEILKFGIQEIQNVSLNTLDALGHLCPDLHSVSLNCLDEDDSSEEDGGLGFRQTTLLTRGLARFSGQLRSLSLQFPIALSELAPPLQHTGFSLISLTLEGIRADGHLPFLDLIRSCPQLKTLTIHIDPPRSNQEDENDDEDLEDWDLPCLSHLCSLTLNFSLDQRQLKPVLCWQSLRGPLWALLRGAPQLQKLSLMAMPCRLDPVFRLVLDHGAKPLGASDQPPLRQLRNVSLKRSDVTMETASRLVDTCHRLSILDLSGCWAMTLSNIKKLQSKASRRLHKLHISWT